jgi:hypothetical protein
MWRTQSAQADFVFEMTIATRAKPWKSGSPERVARSLVRPLERGRA